MEKSQEEKVSLPKRYVLLLILFVSIFLAWVAEIEQNIFVKDNLLTQALILIITTLVIFISIASIYGLLLLIDFGLKKI